MCRGKMRRLRRGEARRRPASLRVGSAIWNLWKMDVLNACKASDNRDACADD